MNLLLLFERDRTCGGAFCLRDRRAEHVRTVLKKGTGDRLRVGLLEGPIGEALITADDPLTLEVSFAEVPPRPEVDLILAVPRPKSLKKLLPEIAAFGVDRLVLLRTWRVAPPFLSTNLMDPAHHRPLLYDGLMQGMHTRCPELIVEPLFKPFFEDRLDAFAANSRRLLAHPYAEEMIGGRVEERVVLVIGPEGGLIEYEVASLVEHGFEPVRLGSQILRVETACVAALAQLTLLRSLPSGSPG